MKTRLQKAALSIRARLNKLFSPQLPLIDPDQDTRDKLKRLTAILDARKIPPTLDELNVIRMDCGLPTLVPPPKAPQNAPEPQSTNTPVQPIPKQPKPRKRKPKAKQCK